VDICKIGPIGPMSHEFIPPHGNYNELLSFKKAKIG
jgi:hypothetical protein